MKKLKYILPALIAMISITSCLKDDKIDNQTYGMINLDKYDLVEIPSDASHVKRFSLLLDNIDTAVNVGTVRLASEKPAASDIVIGLSAANTSEAVDSFNLANPNNLIQAYPADQFKLPASVTIPKGAQDVSFQITINPSQLDPQLPKAIAVQITGIEGGGDGIQVSGNFGQNIFVFGAKSKYEASYTYKCKISGGATANTSESDWPLETVSENTVSADGIGDYFSGYTEYTFNGDGTVTVAAFDSKGGSSYGASVVSSHYDEATGDFSVKFTILGGGYTFDETFVRN